MNHHHHTEPTVNWLRYLIDGDGQWMTRWHCSGGDALLCALTIVAATWMLVEYFRYAFNSHYAMQIAKDGSCYRHHFSCLRNVFLECGTIHFFTMILSWVWTPYWFVLLLVLHNAWQSHRLNNAKLETLAAQEYAKLRQERHDALNKQQTAENQQRALELENSTLKQQLEPFIKKLEATAQ